LAQQLQAIFAARADADFVSLVLEDAAHGFADTGLIIDNQDVCHGYSLDLVILSEAKDLLFAADCRSLASLGMTIHEGCYPCVQTRLQHQLLARRRSADR